MYICQLVDTLPTAWVNVTLMRHTVMPYGYSQMSCTLNDMVNSNFLSVYNNENIGKYQKMVPSLILNERQDEVRI